MSVTAAERELDFGGIRIHYLDWGTAGRRPLLLLHGIARTAHTFDHLAPRFPERFHVIAADLRGHGDSGWAPDGAYLVEDYTRDIERLIEALELRDLVVWGNSTGGRVAQYLAGTRPELVAAAIVEDVGPERPPAVSARRQSRMAEEENGWAQVSELLARARSHNPLASDALLRHLVEHGSKRREDGRIVWKRDPAILNGFVPTELWDAVRGIRAPITYILGGDSTIVPQNTQDRLREVLPQVEIVSMPGLGHYPSDEDPDAFVAVVERFLARVL